ncbi:hypothetical protein MH117_23805 [Paenibacillus sp. ACRRX]|uniref:hypothetical protein n=1 Tax=Paenibacillus sp. ACRRX TaxID=2918206 RepID=UPI001EF631B9|nr:hypothetical protein [Paenibacillus sp. ACRRX]MCG7410424.1 hypothetical protein [Paenibacillus sp. ACRRX]
MTNEMQFHSVFKGIISAVLLQGVIHLTLCVQDYSCFSRQENEEEEGWAQL